MCVCVEPWRRGAHRHITEIKWKIVFGWSSGTQKGNRLDFQLRFGKHSSRGHIVVTTRHGWSGIPVTRPHGIFRLPTTLACVSVCVCVCVLWCIFGSRELTSEPTGNEEYSELHIYVILFAEDNPQKYGQHWLPEAPRSNHREILRTRRVLNVCDGDSQRAWPREWGLGCGESMESTQFERNW